MTAVAREAFLTLSPQVQIGYGRNNTHNKDGWDEDVNEEPLVLRREDANSPSRQCVNF